METRHYVRHGLTYHPLYNRWAHMKARCYNKNNTRYAHYGGRGIVVCDAWKHDFSQYVKDVGLPPTPRHTLDRIDNNGNYEPGNVRWATYEQQNHNRGIARNNTSGATGVARDKTGKKWRAYICEDKKIRSLGHYSSKVAAIEARRAAEALYV